MNEYAFRHRQRLDFAAQKLARDIAAMRADPHLPKLYRELYESLEARLAAVTAARIRFGRWLRQHPDASVRQVRIALIDMKIPVTRPALRRAIHRLNIDTRRRVQASWRAAV
ncbi:MAG TPA: hypothetical protein VGP72_31305 [Planctomycetota bacterium]|jgi:hypothetical protein